LNANSFYLGDKTKKMNSAYFFEIKNVKDKIIEGEMEKALCRICKIDTYDYLAFFEDDEIEYVYLFLDDDIPHQIAVALEELNILINFREASNEVLTANLNKPFWSNWEAESQEKIHRYIEQNLSLDHVLDKINLWGMDSLTELDWLKLKSDH